ncbi:MAG: cache domain-containing protein [Actinomycetota bacterium]
MQIGLTGRFAAGLVAVSLTTALVVGLAVDRYFSEVIGEAQVRELNGRYDQLTAAIAASADQAEAMAALVASLPGVAAELGSGDRAALDARFVAAYPALAKTYGIDQFQFHTPPATSFLRVHMPRKFGDDLSSFRQTVVHTNTVKVPTHGLESGVAGLGVRGVVPVTDNGRHVGSVEFGMSFGKPFFEDFKRSYAVDVGLLLPAKEGGFKAFANTAADSLLTADELARAMAGTPVIKAATRDGISVAVLGRAVPDYAGKPVGVAEIAMDTRLYAGQLAEARRTILLLAVAAVALASAVGLIMARGITGPVRAMIEAMDRIRRRDFDFPLPGLDRADEMGGMARAMAVLRDEAAKVAHAEEEQTKLVSELAEGRRELHRGMEAQLEGVVEAAIQSNEASVVLARMMGSVRKAASESQSIAAAIEEMVASINEIARNSDNAAEEAGGAETAARAGVAAAGQARGAMEALVEAVDLTAGKVTALAEVSTRIGEVVGLINDIAGQTNLLALNATIEAARAGDAGKGFAVVAGEVKALATQTARATEDISGRIERLRTDMDGIVAAMQQSRRAADQGREAVDAVTGQLDSIASRVDAVTGSMRDVADILSQQTSAAHEISGGAARIAGLSNHNYEEIGNVLGAMGNATRVLDDRVEQFARMGTARSVIEVAKNDHVRFKRSVIDAMMDRSDVTSDRLADHHTCRLGRWYDGIEDATIRNHPAYARLLDPHQRVHAHGRRALDLHAEGRIEEALAEVEHLNAASAEVIALLDDLANALPDD